MTIDPRVGFYLSLVGVIIGVFANMPEGSLVTLFGTHGAAVVGILAPASLTIITGVSGILHMVPSGNTPADQNKFLLGPAAPPVPPVVKPLILLALILTALLLPSAAFAQQKPKDLLGVPGGVVNRPITGDLHSGAGAQADPLQALADKFNADLAADLTQALALATQTDSKGNQADATAVPCYQALIDLNKTINGLNIPPAPTPPAGTPAPTPIPDTALVTKFEKLRIAKNALTNQAFKDACAPLIQDIQATGNQLLAQVFAIVGGAAKLGIALP